MSKEDVLVRMGKVVTVEGISLYTLDRKRFIDPSPVFGVACFELEKDSCSSATHKGMVKDLRQGKRWLEYKEVKLVKVYPIGGKMATREQIREGIDMKAPIPQALNRVFLDFLADYDGYKAGALSEQLDFYIARAITNAMYALHSQGVVLKVEDNSYVAPCLRSSWEEIKQDIKETGYELTKPLIEE